jgi:hypothetical protein
VPKSRNILDEEIQIEIWKGREIATVGTAEPGDSRGSTQGARHVPENEQDHGAKADEHRDHGENVGQFGHGHEHGGHCWDAGCGKGRTQTGASVAVIAGRGSGQT